MAERDSGQRLDIQDQAADRARLGRHAFALRSRWRIVRRQSCRGVALTRTANRRSCAAIPMGSRSERSASYSRKATAPRREAWPAFTCPCARALAAHLRPSLRQTALPRSTILLGHPSAPPPRRSPVVARRSLQRRHRPSDPQILRPRQP
jgi:hypothetical protein